MSTVVVNAISLKEGGALVLLQNLLAEMVRLRPEWQWHVATNEVARQHLPDLRHTSFHVYPEHRISGLGVRLWYETVLPRLLQHVKADLLFSQTNYLPARKLPCPALLLVQHAGHFSDVFKRLNEEQLPGLAARLAWRQKGRWVRNSIRSAQMVTVQTEALVKRIVQDTGVSRDRTRVIPHGIGLAMPQDALAQAPVAGQPVRMGYVTKYGVQKNFGVLFAAAAQLKAQGVRPVIVLTLDPDHPGTQSVLYLARQHGVQDAIENHGEVSPFEIDAIYRDLHLSVFPSLCESFGFPMVEAMAYGLPLLIADVESNLEVAGQAGLPFPRHDSDALAELIGKLVEDPAWHKESARASQVRAAHFSWGGAAAATLELIAEMLDTEQRRRS